MIEADDMNVTNCNRKYKCCWLWFKMRVLTIATNHIIVVDCHCGYEW